MLQETKKFRKEIYDYIKGKGVELDDKDMSFLSAKIEEHGRARENNYKEIRQRYAVANEKIGIYLKKAKTMPQTQLLKTQVETLKLVSNWLNSDAE
jgi:hypothetical protein